MEKAPIKKFAVEARRKLIADVTFQLERYGITEKGIVEPQTSTDKELVFDLGNGNVQTIRGVRAVNQYKNLAAHVRGFYTADEPKKELEQFIEEIAYTWFNRLIAIRFMEVNRYLPVRVLSSEITGQKLPDLVKAPFSGDLEFTEDEKKRIFELQDANKEDDLFRFLFFKQCNDLSRILPRLFENLEGHPDFDKSDWKYYLDEAPQEPQVEQQLKDIRAQYAKMEPEQLKVIDPCMGSGHILCYLFDVLMQIYLDNGYSKREAVRSILENNLFGLDIDKRAAQFAYFSVMMKAREYDSNFFSRSHIPQPRVYDIQESNWMGGAYKHEMGSFLNSQEHRDTLNYLLDAFVDAKEYGSILQIKPLDYEGLKEAWETSAAATASNVNMAMWYDAVKDSVAQLIEQAIMLSQKYDAVVTNPPYMGSSGMGAPLANFVKKYYPDSKSDLFAVFIEVCSHMAAEKRYQAMITQHAWMFLSSYEKLREKMMLTETVNMAHLGARAFEEIGGEVVQTTSFVRCRTHIDGYKGTYCRLIEPTSQQGKEDMFLSGENRYFAEQDNFARIPGNPMAYWLSSKFIALLSAPKSIGKTYQSGSGLSTADNERFLRFFWEVEDNKIANFKEDEKKWFLFNKGGEYRKWYGNLQYVVNWENDGEEIKYWVTHNPKDPNTTSWSRRIFNTNLYFLSGVTWSVISSGKISFRAIDTNAMISNAAGGVFGFKNAKERNAFMAAVNSTIWTKIFATINPTLNYSSGVIQKAPAPEIISSDRCDECVELSKEDWDAFETSWDFKKHPLV